MKVLTNVQDRPLAGINRVCTSLVAYLQASHTSATLVPVAVSSVGDTGAGWVPGQVCGARGWRAVVSESHQTLDGCTTLTEAFKRYGPLIRAYQEILVKEQPDLVLVSGTYYRSWCILQAARSLNIPYLVHYHGAVTKESGKDDAAQSIALLMERDFATESATQFIFPSRVAQEHARSVFGRDIVAHIVPNGVPSIFFNTSARRDARSLGFVLRWEPIKNTDFLKQFFIENETQQNPYTLHLVSDATKEDVPDLPHLVRHDPMDTPQLAQFFASVGAVLCPSLFETFGNVATEAAATGALALVSPTMGVAEVFKASGLERLVVPFTTPRATFQLLPGALVQDVTVQEREALRALVSNEVVYARIAAILQEAARH